MSKIKTIVFSSLKIYIVNVMNEISYTIKSNKNKKYMAKIIKDCRFFIFLGQLLVYWGINRIFAPFKEYFNLKD